MNRLVLLAVVASMGLVACVIDGPFGADVGGVSYTANCEEIRDRELGDPLPAAESTLGDALDARTLRGVDPAEAIAVLVPGPRCDHAGEAWQLFFNDDISSERADEIVGMFED